MYIRQCDSTPGHNARASNHGKLYRKRSKRPFSCQNSSNSDSNSKAIISYDDSIAEKHDFTAGKEQPAKKIRKAERNKRKLVVQVATEENMRSSPQVAIAAQTPPNPIHPKYNEDPELSKISEDKIQSFLNTNFIRIDSLEKKVLRPIFDFSYLPLCHEGLKEVFADFKIPTPIQSAAWPFLLNGDDVIGVAETGSGKTFAFGVPCINYVASTLSTRRKGKCAKAVIVSPTRELAMQIYSQLTKLAVVARCEVVCIYGGVPKDDQRSALASANIIVATPGRLNDFIREGTADLADVGYVVLDEADRMFDKGFEEEVHKIVSVTKSANRQMCMFTATWPTNVRKLAAKFMNSPVKIMIGENANASLRANSSIAQKVEIIDPRAKDQRLLQLLNQYQSGQNKSDRILVFCLYKKEASRTESYIRSKGFKVAGIHGDLGQSQRTASLEAFREGRIPLLVATDVAARGLDIPAVKVVINLTFPLTVEDYVHRIGRTGRAGHSGLAITMFTENEKALSGSLINVLKAANQCVPDELLKFGTTVKKRPHEAYGAFYREPLGDIKATRITFE